MARGGARDDLLNGEPCCNISGKNKSFCELTVVYWAWKNIKKLYPNLEYIGVNHSRRYFSFNKSTLFSGAVYEPESAVREYKLNLGKLESILSSCDAVLTKRYVRTYSVNTIFGANLVNYADLSVLRRIVHDKCPDYDLAMFNATVGKNKFSPCNMCIMRWRDFDAYCEWLFDILFEAERQIDISTYNVMQRRVFGYMAEILLNVWVAHRGLKVTHLPYVWFLDEPNAPLAHRAQARARYSLSFFFIKPRRKFSQKRYAEMLERYAAELERMK